MNRPSILILIGVTLALSACGPKKTKTQARPTPDPNAMFLVEKTSVSNQSVKVGRFSLEPKGGNVLFVSVLQFTERGKAIKPEELKTMKVSPMSQNFSGLAMYGPLVAPGDMQYRLSDGRLFPCTLLPLTEHDPSPPMTITSPAGEPSWLMYVGHVQAVCSVPQGATPIAIVWGEKYEAPVWESEAG